MATKLRDLIRSIRSCKTAAEERALISKEKAAIRTSFTDSEEEYRARNIAKLLFINMLGHDTDFGQIECLKLITSQNYSDKKIGYLGLTHLFNEKSEVLMMATHRMRTDLQSGTHYVTALALSSLSEITTADMCKELAPEVAKLMVNGNNYIKKKAALAATRIVRRVPELAEDFIDKIPKLVEERHHGVLLSTISLMIEIIDSDAAHKEKFKKFVPFLVKVLKNLASSYSAEFEISGIIDPFLQIEILKFFGQMGEKDEAISEEINDILTQVATNTPANKNTGNAVLFECVRCIMKIESTNTLKTLAIGILGKFLSSKESNARNLRYVALQSLQNVVKFDLASVQKHKSTILECLRVELITILKIKENDISIKKLALDVLYLITNEKNVESIVKEMLNCILVSEPEFLQDLALKICTSVEKYSPDRRWHIDTIIKVLTLAGNYVKDESIYSLLHLISATVQLQSYTVTKLFFTLRENTNQEGLAKVTLWCFGEFGSQLISGKAMSSDNQPIRVTEREVMDLIGKILTKFNVSEQVKLYALNSLIKLFTKFSSSREQIKTLIDSQTTSALIEVQQRACEYLQLLDGDWDEVRGLILEPIPLCKSVDFSAKPVGDTTIWEVPPNAERKQDTTTATTGGNNANDLLLLDDAPIVTSTPTTSKPNTDLVSGSSGLLDEINLTAPITKQETKPDLSTNLLNLYGNVGQQQTFNPQPSFNTGFGQPNLTQNTGNLLDSINFNTTPIQTFSQNNNSLGGLNSLSFGNTQTNTTSDNDPSKLTIKVMEDNNLEIVFNCQKESFDTTAITTVFNNKAGAQITNLAFKVAVTKGLNLTMNPITSTSIQAYSKGGVTQSMKIVNPNQGKKAIAMKVKISYDINGSTVNCPDVTVSSFPSTY